MGLHKQNAEEAAADEANHGIRPHGQVLLGVTAGVVAALALYMMFGPW